MKTSKPKLLAGFGDKNFGKQYRQGNRIYDSEGVGMCLNASPVGNTGGYSYLYVVKSDNKDRMNKEIMENNKNNNSKKGYELINFCEFDKYATKSYCAIHGVDESLNLGDITKVDETQLKPFNMICGGSPCQDFSISGKQVGSKWKCNDCGHEYNPLTIHYSKRNCCPECNSENLDKTRSSLLVEWLRIIRANKPKWGIYENVKNIVGKKFKDTFQMFLDELHEYGYNTYYKVLNAKDYGIPQNRERVYLIIILKEFDNGQFKFPEGFDNGKRLKDVLEDEVDEKFYINTPKAKELIDDLISSGKLDKEIKYRKNRGERKHRPTSMGYDTNIKTGLFSKQCSQFDKEINIANTLLARDYKGFGNQSMNGVIECVRDKGK